MEDNGFRNNRLGNNTLQYVTISLNGSAYLWDDWSFLNASDRETADNNGSAPMSPSATSSNQLTVRVVPDQHSPPDVNNYWGLLALVLVFGTAAGNILVCLAIAWERRLQNVTNYFLMSLAITDLMVAVLVMPLGILTLVYGYFPLQSEHCLVWICLDVLFCTASIMHLCTISVDRYLSLRYPMKFGRNKTRRRVTLKIIFVWLLSIAMSLPLSLMYSQNSASVLVKGTCQIPDPVYKLVGSIVCFYIPLGVMLLTYYLTVRLLAQQRQNLGGTNHHPSGWASGWLGQAPALERRCTWRRLLKTGHPSTPNHAHSATSTDTELSTLDTHELWLPDSSIPEPTPSTMTALHQFGAEMLKLSRGLESVGLPELSTPQKHGGDGDHAHRQETSQFTRKQRLEFGPMLMRSIGRTSSPTSPSSLLEHIRSSRHRRSRSSWTVSMHENQSIISPSSYRKRYCSLPSDFLALHKDCNKVDQISFQIGEVSSPKSRKHSSGDIERGDSGCYGPRQSMMLTKNDYLELPPPCTCPYFGDRPFKATPKPTEVKIISSTHFQGNSVDSKEFTTTTVTVSNQTNGKKSSMDGSIYLPLPAAPVRKLSYSKTASVVTWDSCRYKRRGSSFGGVRTSLLLTPTKVPVQGSPLRRSATLRNHNNANLLNCDGSSKSMKPTPSSPCLLQRNATVRSHHSRNSSVISRNSSRHGRIIRLEQKATKVLGVVFFTFVILWAPFFVLNLLPTVCGRCEENISHWVFDFVTWLGYASSMVNPIFYTIFNKVFRQAFKKVLLCKYGGKSNWRPNR